MEKKAAEMNVTMERVSELVPAEYNPRKAMSGREREALKSSIAEYGMVYPVVVNDRTGRIVGGHQRVSVMKELGIEEAPVVHVDMDEEQEKRANVALNAIEADWDVEKLQELVHPMTAEEVQALGWTKVESEALLAGLFLLLRHKTRLQTVLGGVVLGLSLLALILISDGPLGVPLLTLGLPGVLSLYFDVFSGVIQAFVFSLLTMIYISGACPPPEETGK